jgi:hypothetical protein
MDRKTLLLRLDCRYHLFFEVDFSSDCIAKPSIAIFKHKQTSETVKNGLMEAEEFEHLLQMKEMYLEIFK